MRKSVYTLLFLFAAIQLVSATNTPPAGTLLLGTIYIQGQKNPLNNTLLTPNTLPAGNQADLGAALGAVPGLFVSLSGSRNETTISLNGFDIKHVPLFLDGIPVYVPYDGYPDLNRFCVATLQGIEVTRGLVPVTLGPNTFAGAINLISRMPAAPFELETGIAVTVDGKNKNNTREGWLRTALSRPTWAVQLALSGIESGGFTLSDSYTPTPEEDGAGRDNSDRRDGSLKLSLRLQPAPETLFRIHYIRQRGEKGIPVYAGDIGFIKRRYWRTPEWNKDSLYLLSGLQLSTKTSLDIRLWFDTFQNTFIAYDDATYTTFTNATSFRSVYDDYTLGGAAKLTTSLWGKDSFTAGLQYKFDKHREHSLTEPVTRTVDSLLHLSAEERAWLTSTLHLTIGAAGSALLPARAEKFYATTTNISNFSLADSFGLDAQVRLEWTLNKDTSLELGLERKTRLPAMKDRYSYKLGKAIPNSGLDSEINNALSLGFSRTIAGRLRVIPRLFCNLATDFITAVTVSPGITQNQNSGTILFYGGSLEVTGVLIPDRLDIDLSYSHIRWHQYEAGPAVTDLSHHKINATLRFKPHKILTLSATIASASARETATDGTQPVSGHCLAGLALQVMPVPSFTITVGINNLLDTDYELTEGYPMPGRHYFVRIGWKY